MPQAPRLLVQGSRDVWLMKHSDGLPPEIIGPQFVGQQCFPIGASSSDHRTPEFVFDYASHRWGPFDLDAAASDENALCENYFTIEDNGLMQIWKGTVWLNHPYNNSDNWIMKAIGEVRYGHADRVVVLAPARTSTKWFAQAFKYCSEMVIIQGRLNFEGPNQIENSAAPFGSVFFVFDTPMKRQPRLFDTLNHFELKIDTPAVSLLDREIMKN
jgi:phage N-6-adenine-methyltransferase